MSVTYEEYIDCLLVLEILRDDIDMTDDETAIVSEAHNIVQEYKRAGDLSVD